MQKSAEPVRITSEQTKQHSTLISQKENFAANFGQVLRSSALFWVMNRDAVSTIISLSNYWKFKNRTDVVVVLNLRRMNGELVSRIPVSFTSADVVNYRPPEDFEGSVEVEAFSISNMRIPYAAVMAIYESRHSISMVHSYARAYSQHEIEDQRTLCNGAESCWTLRDTEQLTSFCVIHNGSLTVPAQTVTLGIRNSHGTEKIRHFSLPKLAPYQSILVEPKAHDADIVTWLDGKPGNGRLQFSLGGGFTRMLCGIRDTAYHQIQVTHSNFDYSTHRTDVLTDGDLTAIMRTPQVNVGLTQEVVIYPDSDHGHYRVYDGTETTVFSTGDIVQKTFASNQGQILHFTRDDQVLPTRIVTALRINSDSTSVNHDNSSDGATSCITAGILPMEPTGSSIIPAECSLGVVHHQVPKKQYAWMTVSDKFNSSISWVDYKEVFHGCPDDAELVLTLYSDHAKEPLIHTIRYSALPSAGNLRLNSIFPSCQFLGETFGYLGVWCSYGGLVFFSTLEKGHSISIEHSF